MIKTNENKISIRYNRPPLANYQLDALFNDARYGIVEASTKAGKTAACLVWIIEQALQGKSGQDFWWICPVYGQAKIAFRRLKAGLPRESYNPNESDLTLILIGQTHHFFLLESAI